MFTETRLTIIVMFIFIISFGNGTEMFARFRKFTPAKIRKLVPFPCQSMKIRTKLCTAHLALMRSCVIGIDYSQVPYTARYNFYDFSQEHPEIDKFDISSCYSPDDKITFKITFYGKNNHMQYLPQIALGY